MKFIFRILFATVLVFVTTKILYPYYHFHVEHIENYLVTHFKLPWVVAPIFIRILLGLPYVGAFLLIFYYKKTTWIKYIAPLLIAIPFILNPVYPSNFSSIENNPTKKIPSNIELSNDTYILAFFSSNCKFCKEGSRKLKAAQLQSDDFPHVHVAAASEEIENFYTETDTYFDYTILEKDSFLFYTDMSFPKYFLIKNNKVVSVYTPQTFNYWVLNHLSKPQ